MKKIRLFLIAALCSLNTPIAFGEDNTGNPIENFLTKHKISIRQSVKDNNTIGKSASFSVVNAAGQDSHEAIDAGITVEAFGGTHYSVSPYIEQHRKTDPSSRKDNLQAGGTFIFYHGNVENEIVHYMQASIAYKEDDVASSHGSVYKITYTPLYNLQEAWAIGAWRGPDQWRYLWQPNLGLGYEKSNDVRKSGIAGSTYRAFGNIEIGIRPFAKSLGNSLELVANGTSWHGLSHSGAFDSLGDHDSFITVSINQYIDDAQHASVGLEYVNGDNPEQGLLDQEATTLTLKIKY